MNIDKDLEAALSQFNSTDEAKYEEMLEHAKQIDAPMYILIYQPQTNQILYIRDAIRVITRARNPGIKLVTLMFHQDVEKEKVIEICNVINKTSDQLEKNKKKDLALIQVVGGVSQDKIDELIEFGENIPNMTIYK